MRIIIGFRALIALAACLVITFTRPDSAALALAIFAGFGFAQGAGSALFAVLRLKTLPAANLLVQGLVSLLAATLAALALGGASASQLVALQLVVVAYLLLTAVFETYLASRLGFKNLEGREHLISAGLATIFAAIYLITNPEPLNAAGFLGAYFALSAVHQAIWAASPAKAD